MEHFLQVCLVGLSENVLPREHLIHFISSMLFIMIPFPHGGKGDVPAGQILQSTQYALSFSWVTTRD